MAPSLPVGNSNNKYGSRNPIQRFLIAQFLEALDARVGALRSRAAGALEVGCGEGYTTSILAKHNFEDLVAVDISDRVLSEAHQRCPKARYLNRNVFDLDSNDAQDLVVCLEVLEHLDEPERALDVLRCVTRKFAILSVPREPAFRTLNFLAGKYLRNWGNAPGHVNHWSRDQFVALISKFFTVTSVHLPLPWTLVVCERQPFRGIS